MDFRKFQFYNVLGAVIWVVSLVYGGYLFGNVPIIRDNLGIVLIVGILAVLATACDRPAAAPRADAAPAALLRACRAGSRMRAPRRLSSSRVRSAGCA